MGVLLMYVLDELRTFLEILREEIHRIPKIVASPVLPVLYDTIQRHLQLAIFIHDTLCFCSCLVTFLRLPESVGPEGEHRYVATQMTHLGDHPVSIATIHEVVIYALANLGVEGHAVSIILK